MKIAVITRDCNEGYGRQQKLVVRRMLSQGCEEDINTRSSSYAEVYTDQECIQSPQELYDAWQRVWNDRENGQESIGKFENEWVVVLND